MRIRNRKRLLILLTAGLLIAAALFFLFYRPLHGTIVPVTDRFLLDANKTRIVWTQDRTLHATEPAGKEVFRKELDFQPQFVQAGTGIIAAADTQQVLVMDERGENEHRVKPENGVEYLQTVEDRVFVFSAEALHVFNANAEAMAVYTADDPWIIVKKAGNRWLGLAARADDTVVRSALYTLDETPVLRFPLTGNWIIDFMGDEHTLAVATTQEIYLEGETTVRIPVTEYRGMLLAEDLFVLDGRTLKQFDRTGTLITETSVPEGHTRLAGETAPILWGEDGFALYDKTGVLQWQKYVPTDRLFMRDGRMILVSGTTVYHGRPAAFRSLP